MRGRQGVSEFGLLPMLASASVCMQWQVSINGLFSLIVCVAGWLTASRSHSS